MNMRYMTVAVLGLFGATLTCMAEDKGTASSTVAQAATSNGVYCVFTVIAEKTAAPVQGVKVFSHKDNTLIGETDSNGRLSTTLPEGQLVRLVEPKYGVQQVVLVVTGTKEALQLLTEQNLLGTVSPQAYEHGFGPIIGWKI